MYVLNGGASKHMENKTKNKKLMKLIEEINKRTIILGASHIPFSVIDGTIRQKISKNIDLNNTISQQNLMGTRRLLHRTAE